MNINILFFDGFETLDAFGAVEVFGKVEEFKLRYISINGGVIESAQGVQIHTQSAKEADLTAALLIPGGQGTRVLVNDELFISRLKELALKSRYCLSVCTGAALLAKTGLLDAQKATTNKKAFEWVVSQNQNVHWLREARWVVEGKFYTSSGVSAGIDMSLGFVCDILGRERAESIARHMEYIWNDDKNSDPFAATYKI